ncbi:hypothetical protein HOF67_03170 [Candidatus Peregrinibacteria bacterium]|jgi:CheY-like chemotaxis protein|nr:hypothetical protein [Candidatus Peregrinibacteria bacterium]
MVTSSLQLGADRKGDPTICTPHQEGLVVAAVDDDADYQYLADRDLASHMECVGELHFLDDGDHFVNFVVDRVRSGRIPDVVLSDVRMNRLDGIEAVQTLIREVGSVVRDKMKLVFWSTGLGGEVCARELGVLLQKEPWILGIVGKEDPAPWGDLLNVVVGSREESAASIANLRRATRKFFDTRGYGHLLSEDFVGLESVDGDAHSFVG